MRVLQRLWQDDAGFIVSAELILIATVAVIGLIAGLATVRNSITNELADVGGAIDGLNQGYSIASVIAHSGDGNSPTIYTDLFDFCNAAPVTGTAMGCITFGGSTTSPVTPTVPATPSET